MSLEVRQLNCPNCGSPVNVQALGRSKQIVCPTCNSQIDLTQPPYSVVGNVGNRPAPIMTPFELGMQGAIGPDTYGIIGRIRYRDTGEDFPTASGQNYDDDDGGDDVWDEWLLLSAAGAYRWISDSTDVGMVLWYPFTPTVPVDPNSIVRGGVLNLGQSTAVVRSRGAAGIEYLEGELTWRAQLGDRMNYAEAVAPDNTLISVEWTESEVEFFGGQRLDREETERSFGVVRPAMAPGGSGGGGRRNRAGCSVVMAIFLVCIVVACILLALFAPASASGGIGGGGIRSGSSGRSFGGGGSSGGGGGGGGK